VLRQKHRGRQADQTATRQQNRNLIDAVELIRHDRQCAPTGAGGSMIH
jgi:hypothetical protein